MKLPTVDLRYWDLQELIRFFFYLGMTITFLGSMSPWFMWPVADKYVLLGSPCFFLSMSMDYQLKKNRQLQGIPHENFYGRSGFLAPVLLHMVLSFYQIFIQGKTINAYIVNFFFIATFFTLFRVKFEELRRFCNLLAKGMGGFLVVSMFFFLLYLMGFPLPGRDASYVDLYSFTNYYFFLIDDRGMFTIIPRFQSIFVEPGHLGTMTALLLFTQIGKWKKWYNISLLIATLISFSLAAYGILVPILFLGQWMRGNNIVKKAFLSIMVLAVITVGSFYYNNGDNLLHNLIMVRLEVNDGELAGDNRVTDDFKADYESLLQSSDVLTGRERNKEEFGNSGYRVFIYDYGLIGLFLLFSFYIVAMYNPRHLKSFVSVLVVALLNFIIRGNIMQYSIFITLYYISNESFNPYLSETPKLMEQTSEAKS